MPTAVPASNNNGGGVQTPAPVTTTTAPAVVFDADFYSTCLGSIRFSELNGDQMLDENEYLRLVNKFSNYQFVVLGFDQLPTILQTNYNTLKTSKVLPGGAIAEGIDVSGSESSAKPTEEEKLYLKNVCDYTNLAIKTAIESSGPTRPIPTPTIPTPSAPTPAPTEAAAPAQTMSLPFDKCTTYMLVSDKNGDEYLTKQEYLTFVNLVASPNWLALGFSNLPNTVQEHYFTLADGTSNNMIDISGAGLNTQQQQLDIEQRGRLGFVCESTLTVIEDFLNGSSETDTNGDGGTTTQPPAPPNSGGNQAGGTAPPSQGPWLQSTIYNEFIVSNAEGLNADAVRSGPYGEAIEEGYQAFVVDQFDSFVRKESKSISLQGSDRLLHRVENKKLSLRQRHDEQGYIRGYIRDYRLPRMLSEFDSSIGDAIDCRLISRLSDNPSVHLLPDEIKTYKIEDHPCPDGIADGSACQKVKGQFKVQTYNIPGTTEILEDLSSDVQSAIGDGLSAYIFAANPGLLITVAEAAPPDQVQPPEQEQLPCDDDLTTEAPVTEEENSPATPTPSPPSTKGTSDSGPGAGYVAGAVISVLLAIIVLGAFAFWCFSRNKNRYQPSTFKGAGKISDDQPARESPGKSSNSVNLGHDDDDDDDMHMSGNRSFIGGLFAQFNGFTSPKRGTKHAEVNYLGRPNSGPPQSSSAEQSDSRDESAFSVEQHDLSTSMSQTSRHDRSDYGSRAETVDNDDEYEDLPSGLYLSPLSKLSPAGTHGTPSGEEEEEAAHPSLGKYDDDEEYEEDEVYDHGGEMEEGEEEGDDYEDDYQEGYYGPDYGEEGTYPGDPLPSIADISHEMSYQSSMGGSSELILLQDSLQSGPFYHGSYNNYDNPERGSLGYPDHNHEEEESVDAGDDGQKQRHGNYQNEGTYQDQGGGYDDENGGTHHDEQNVYNRNTYGEEDGNTSESYDDDDNHEDSGYQDEDEERDRQEYDEGEDERSGSQSAGHYHPEECEEEGDNYGGQSEDMGQTPHYLGQNHGNSGAADPSGRQPRDIYSSDRSQEQGYQSELDPANSTSGFSHERDLYSIESDEESARNIRQQVSLRNDSAIEALQAMQDSRSTNQSGITFHGPESRQGAYDDLMKISDDVDVSSSFRSESQSYSYGDEPDSLYLNKTAPRGTSSLRSESQSESFEEEPDSLYLHQAIQERDELRSKDPGQQQLRNVPLSPRPTAQQSFVEGVSPTTSLQSSTSAVEARRRLMFRQQVETLLHDIAPEELGNIDEMMDRFAGREAELLNTLQVVRDRSNSPAQRARNAVHKSKGLPPRTNRAPQPPPKTENAAVAIAAASTIETKNLTRRHTAPNQQTEDEVNDHVCEIVDEDEMNSIEEEGNVQDDYTEDYDDDYSEGRGNDPSYRSHSHEDVDQTNEAENRDYMHNDEASYSSRRSGTSATGTTGAEQHSFYDDADDARMNSTDFGQPMLAQDADRMGTDDHEFEASDCEDNHESEIEDKGRRYRDETNVDKDHYDNRADEFSHSAGNDESGSYDERHHGEEQEYEEEANSYTHGHGKEESESYDDGHSGDEEEYDDRYGQDAHDEQGTNYSAEEDDSGSNADEYDKQEEGDYSEGVDQSGNYSDQYDKEEQEYGQESYKRDTQNTEQEAEYYSDANEGRKSQYLEEDDESVGNSRQYREEQEYAQEKYGRSAQSTGHDDNHHSEGREEQEQDYSEGDDHSGSYVSEYDREEQEREQEKYTMNTQNTDQDAAEEGIEQQEAYYSDEDDESGSYDNEYNGTEDQEKDNRDIRNGDEDADDYSNGNEEHEADSSEGDDKSRSYASEYDREEQDHEEVGYNKGIHSKYQDDAYYSEGQESDNSEGEGKPGSFDNEYERDEQEYEQTNDNTIAQSIEKEASYHSDRSDESGSYSGGQEYEDEYSENNHVEEHGSDFSRGNDESESHTDEDDVGERENTENDRNSYIEEQDADSHSEGSYESGSYGDSYGSEHEHGQIGKPDAHTEEQDASYYSESDDRSGSFEEDHVGGSNDAVESKGKEKEFIKDAHGEEADISDSEDYEESGSYGDSQYSDEISGHRSL